MGANPYTPGLSGPVTNYNFSNVGGSVSYATGWTGTYNSAGELLALYYSTPVPQQPQAVAASTGVNPVETSYSLYGHIIPLSVFGVGRIGGEIIAGPWVENGAASFIISFGVPADPAGIRDLREIAFDSEVVWTAAGGFSTEPFTYRFYGGTLTQTADALETTHFGGEANAYRPQILLAFENLPLANTKFQKIPYVAALIGDATGDDVSYAEAWERLAYSPWVGKTPAEFETQGLTDGLPNGGLIFAENAEFLATLQQFGRFYSNWDILQTDKLRVVDRSDVIADIALDAHNLIGAVTIARQGFDSVKRDLELSTVDNSADYTIVPSIAQRPRDPVVVTTSVGTDTAYLPAIMDPFTRMAIATYARYHEETTRKTITGTAMAYGLEIEPGALIAVRDLGDDFPREIFKVVETLHGANYTVEFTATAIMRCQIGDPVSDHCWPEVVLLTGFEDGPDGSTVIVDESPVSHGAGSVFGGAQIDTALFKFGAGSGLFGGGAAIAWTSADFSLGSVWTVECWAMFNSLASEQCLMAQWTGIGSANSWMFRTQPSNVLQFFMHDGATFSVVINSAPSAITTGVWYHIAADSNGSKVRFYLNGVMVGSATPTSTFFGNAFVPLRLGDDGLGSRPFNGRLDEVRLTKCLRYDSDAGFTPPTAPYPRF